MHKYSEHGAPKEHHVSGVMQEKAPVKTHTGKHADVPAGHGKRQNYATGTNPFHSGKGPGRGH